MHVQRGVQELSCHLGAAGREAPGTQGSCPVGLAGPLQGVPRGRLTIPLWGDSGPTGTTASEALPTCAPFCVPPKFLGCQAPRSLPWLPVSPRKLPGHQ